MLPDFTSLTAVCIESIQAAALASSTGKAGMRGGQGGFNTLTGVIFTEGELYGALRALNPSLRVILAPRTAILQQFLGYWPYRKGLNVDAAVLAALRLLHPDACRPNNAHTHRHLGSVDHRDAYLAAIYSLPHAIPAPPAPFSPSQPHLPPLTLGIDPAATVQRSAWVLTSDTTPIASGKCDELLGL